MSNEIDIEYQEKDSKKHINNFNMRLNIDE
jgi:hypothetical protein